MEKDSFAIRPGIQVFHVHLLGRPLLHAQTDNSALLTVDRLTQKRLHVIWHSGALLFSHSNSELNTKLAKVKWTLSNQIILVQE